MEENLTIENFNPFFTIIIPAYNCREFIMRLLNSINKQEDYDMSKVEVLIVDDNSTDNFMEVVTESDLNLNIRYCKTKPRRHHCPGNTRMDGLHEAKGEWITFVDHDDELDPHALAIINAAIDQNNETRFVFSKMGEYHKDGREIRHYDFRALTWHHGKFYNRQWLIDSGIDFKENLMSHEDLYFNNTVMDELCAHDNDYTLCDYETYKWIYEPQSLSRKPDEGRYNYMELNIEDFVAAGTEPHIAYAKKYPAKKELYRQRVIVNLLHLYYYYEGMLCKNGEKDPMNEKVLGIIRKVVLRISTHFNYYKNQIVAEVYQNAESVEHIRKASIPGIGFFVERHSFVDFMRQIV